MKKVFKIILWALVGLVFIGTFVYLFYNSREKEASYELVSPATGTVERTTVLTGKIEPRDEIEIKPQISGIISEILVEAGDQVKDGDVIARIRVIPEQTQLSSAENRVEVARISLEEAKLTFERTKTLYEKKYESRERFEADRAAYERAVKELDQARDQLTIVRDGVSAANAQNSNTLVRSTVTGLVLEVPVKVGSSVIQANTFNDGTTIATVADMSNMLFRGNVDETDVGKLNEGMPVKLTIGALQNVELDARLEYVSPKATEDNGVVLFEVKAAVTVPAKVFVRAGYSANASVMIESREGVLTLPESTVEFENGKSYVHVLTSAEGAEEQTFDKREVQIGLSDGINIEIKEGVTAGDNIRGVKEDKKKK